MFIFNLYYEQLLELKNINILVKLPNISIYPHLFNNYNDFCVYIKNLLNDIILKSIKNNTNINESIFNNYIETINNKINIYSTNSILIILTHIIILILI